MKTIRLTDSEYDDLFGRLVMERACQMDAAREADKKGDGLGDGWREQAEKTRQLIAIFHAAGAK